MRPRHRTTGSRPRPELRQGPEFEAFRRRLLGNPRQCEHPPNQNCDCAERGAWAAFADAVAAFRRGQR